MDAIVIGVLIASVLAAMAAKAIIAKPIDELSFEIVVDWFRNRNELKKSKDSIIAFTLMQKVEIGGFKTVQGVFDQELNNVLDHVVYLHAAMDAKLSEIHEDKELVLYE